MFRGLVRRQTNTDKHDPESCQGFINDKCPVPNFKSSGPEVKQSIFYKISLSWHGYKPC